MELELGLDPDDATRLTRLALLAPLKSGRARSRAARIVWHDLRRVPPGVPLEDLSALCAMVDAEWQEFVRERGLHMSEPVMVAEIEAFMARVYRDWEAATAER